MRSAILLTTNSPIDIDDVIPTVGRTTIDGVQVPRAFECVFCGGRMHPHTKVGKRVANFAHAPGSNCPTTPLAARAFRHLRHQDADPAAAQALRVAFHHTWRWHFDRIRQEIPGFSVNEFQTILQRSLADRIWLYRDLELWELPFIFLQLADFSPATAYGHRPLWIRFWVRSERNYDLWIWPRQRGRLVKGHFQPRPRGAPPKYSDLLTLEIVTTNSDFMQKDMPDVHPYIVDRMVNWLRDHQRQFVD